MPASFTNLSRHIVEEDEIKLTSVGVDIGSSTSHLVFSRLEMRQEGTRYVVARREILNESEIFLTPYLDDLTIDVRALEEFINRQYERAGMKREDVDTGALILTGVAVRRRNSRAIGELFAQEAGRFVAVSAGDSLESTMAAYGSGAVAESARSGGICMNIDVGGGTSKFAICAKGRVREVTAIDVGARLVVLDGAGVVTRIEEAGRFFAAAVGLNPAVGHKMDTSKLPSMASLMADKLFEVMSLSALSPETQRLLRLPPLSYRGQIDAITFSGGVSEFIYGHNPGNFGDLGALLAAEVKKRAQHLAIPVLEPTARIRATVIGASQYTIQVSGSTIFIEPLDAVPVRNVPVVVPELPLDGDDIDQAAIRRAVEMALSRLDLTDGKRPVAVGFHWEGSATFARLDAFCSGVKDGLEKVLGRGHPLMLVSDGDIGGILGLHFKEEMRVENPVISIDGIALSEFDYIDIGALIPSSGAVPVVVKSLIFPAPTQPNGS
ncbi:MAG: ethanolamine utilization protein EutA [Deltaproteobacteria bacterium RIFCSPLOWO2_12_55_13]|nr:MAG: ethanolamine utilization protein EutA [Deltaproteobacteria bacterium RIFCSPLOWO2_12_55_13]